MKRRPNSAYFFLAIFLTSAASKTDPTACAARICVPDETAATTGQNNTASGEDDGGDGGVPSPQCIDYPVASERAISYLKSLDPHCDFKYVIFNDCLLTMSDSWKELGDFTVSIKPAKFKGQHCFVVHADSHGAVDGIPCGTSIVCHVALNLDTLEQHHHEYVKLKNCPLDRKTTLTKEEDCYVINRSTSQGQDTQHTSTSVPSQHMKGFISEGSNLLLHRIFIDKGFPEEMQFISFDTETHLCPAVYTPLKEHPLTVGDAEVMTYGVERTILSEVDMPTTWQSYFLVDGHMASRVQVGSPVTMRLAKMPTLIEKDDEPPKPTFEKRALLWEEDIQMRSDFLDRKEALMNDHTVYMRHHPDVKALMADFLTYLLLRKPVDVIEFAAGYFSTFSASTPTASHYQSSASGSRYPFSRTTSRIESLRSTPQ